MASNNDEGTVQPLVDLAELFAMPLTALIEADAQASQTFFDFIRRYGFERNSKEDGEQLGKLKMVAFSYNAPGPEGQPSVVNIEVPLLLLIPLPLLTIDTAAMKFGVDILGILDRSDSTMNALEQGRLPKHRRPVSWGRRQLRVRMARNPGVIATEGAAGQNPEAKARSHISMSVDVQLKQSDLPQGLIQMLNLTAQSTQAIERPVPFISLEVTSGERRFTAWGDRLSIGLAIMGLPAASVAGTTVDLNQSPESLFVMPREVKIGADGRASFEIVLPDSLEDAEARLVLQTVTATAEVQSRQFGVMTAIGGIEIQVNIEE